MSKTTTGTPAPPELSSLEIALAKRHAASTAGPPPVEEGERPTAHAEELEEPWVPAAQDDDGGPDDRPTRSIGRTGRGMVNRVLYLRGDTMGELDKFADDLFFGSRGRVHRWRVYDAVMKVGLTPAQKKKIMKQLAPELLRDQPGAQ